jgi:cytochrome b561
MSQPEIQIQAVPSIEADPPQQLQSTTTDLAESDIRSPAPAGNDHLGMRKVHWTLLLLASAVMILTFIMQREGQSVVNFPFTNYPLPQLCSMKRTYGIDCPGCGLTRSFLSIGRFQFAQAMHFNPAGIFVFGLIAVQIPWRITQLARIRKGLPQLQADWFLWYLGICVVVMVGQWLVRLSGFSF